MSDTIEFLLDEDVCRQQLINLQTDECSYCDSIRFKEIVKHLDREKTLNCIYAAVRSNNLLPIYTLIAQDPSFKTYIPDIIFFSCKLNNNEVIRTLMIYPYTIQSIAKREGLVEDCLRMAIYHNNEPLFILFHNLYDVPIQSVYDLFQKEMVCVSVFFGYINNISYLPK